MTEIVWLLRATIDAMHDMQLAEHGGLTGVRDTGLLESALARPRNLDSYGSADIHTLAAACAFGIVRNHPYIDGNKRTAFLAAYTFLRLNGAELQASEVSATQTMLALAAGEIGEDDFAAWLRENSVLGDGVV